MVLILFRFRASLTAESAVLAATLSIDKIAITSLGLAFAAALSDIGSDSAKAAKADTSTPFFFLLAVTTQTITMISTITNQINERNITVFQTTPMFGIISIKSSIANFLAP
ncbi:MAG: hypothetical protein ACTSP5_10255 [Candidatus Heimdallarchaeota archaeon]